MSVATIYIGAAVLPALVLMFYVYKKDKIEKESPRLLIRLILMCFGRASFRRTGNGRYGAPEWDRFDL